MIVSILAFSTSAEKLATDVGKISYRALEENITSIQLNLVCKLLFTFHVTY